MNIHLWKIIVIGILVVLIVKRAQQDIQAFPPDQNQQQTNK